MSCLERIVPARPGRIVAKDDAGRPSGWPAMAPQASASSGAQALQSPGRMGLKYDANTNLVAYAYDAANRKRYAFDAAGRKTPYRYDTANRRREYDSNNNLTGYRYDERNLLILQPYRVPARQSAAWPSAPVGENLTPTYVYGSYIDEVLCMVKANGDRYWYSTNDLYSVYALTNSAGTVVERYMYDPYGFVTVLDGNGTPRTVNESAYGNPWTFTGRRLDGETGLMQYRRRMYSVDLGQFLSRDPIRYWGGINLYRAYFVPGATDPWGLAVRPGEGIVSGSEAVRSSKDLAVVGALLGPALGKLLEKLSGGLDTGKGKDLMQWLAGNLNDPFVGALIANAAGRFAGIAGEGKNQWVFTCKCGWIDMGHFWASALVAYRFGWAKAYGGGILTEIVQEHGPGQGGGWGQSAWTAEDLTTDLLGSLFGESLRAKDRNVSLPDDFKKLLEDCGAVEVTPENRPILEAEAEQLEKLRGDRLQVLPEHQQRDYLNPLPYRGQAYEKLCCPSGRPMDESKRKDDEAFLVKIKAMGFNQDALKAVFDDSKLKAGGLLK